MVDSSDVLGLVSACGSAASVTVVLDATDAVASTVRLWNKVSFNSPPRVTGVRPGLRAICHRMVSLATRTFLMHDSMLWLNTSQRLLRGVSFNATPTVDVANFPLFYHDAVALHTEDVRDRLQHVDADQPCTRLEVTTVFVGCMVDLANFPVRGFGPGLHPLRRVEVGRLTCKRRVVPQRPAGL